ASQPPIPPPITRTRGSGLADKRQVPVVPAALVAFLRRGFAAAAGFAAATGAVASAAVATFCAVAGALRAVALRLGAAMPRRPRAAGCLRGRGAIGFGFFGPGAPSGAFDHVHSSRWQ